VTATGEVVRASATEHPDLFWALRVAETSGVVTRFEFRLHPVGPDVLSGLIVYPISRPKSVLQQYRKIHSRGARGAFRWDCPAPGAATAVPPESMHGKAIIALALIYAGDPKQGRVAHRAVAQIGTPVGEHVGVQALRRLAADLRPGYSPLAPVIIGKSHNPRRSRTAFRRYNRVHREDSVTSV